MRVGIAVIVGALVLAFVYVANRSERVEIEPPPPSELPKQPKAPPAPAIADSDTAKLLDRMDAALYAPAQKGLTKASLKGELKVLMKNELDAREGSFEYRWDNGAGKLTFSRPSHQELASQAGLRGEKIDNYLTTLPWQKRYAGCTLRARVSGGKTKIDIDGKLTSGIKSLELNDQGLPSVIALEMLEAIPPGTGELMIDYSDCDSQFLPRRVERRLFVEGLEPVTVVTDYRFAKVGKYHVILEESLVTSIGDQKFGTATITYSDYRFDEEVATAER